MGQIDLFKNYSYLIGLCEKKKTLKKSKETTTQKCKYERTINEIPKPLGIR